MSASSSSTAAVHTMNTMTVLWPLVSLLIAAEGLSVHQLVLQEWELFKVEHNKSYSSQTEENHRLGVYLNNRKMIAEHNARYERGEVTYTMGMNQFGDMLDIELMAMMYPIRPEYSSGNDSHYLEPANVVIADSVDWRTKGAVTPVKNQGLCGSCWAFSTTGAVEGQHFRKTGKLVPLSEQNLVDCSRRNYGCFGGLMSLAFKYIISNKGIDTEKGYPYVGIPHFLCRFKRSQVGATISSYVSLPAGDEAQLKSAVATVGPVSVAIHASRTFMRYKSGVYYEPNCSSSRLNHAVLVVGYGTDGGQDYWLVKNSWRASWGEQGYIKMARNKRNNCGIAASASYPVV